MRVLLGRIDLAGRDGRPVDHWRIGDVSALIVYRGVREFCGAD